MTTASDWFEVLHHVDTRRDIFGADIKYGTGRVTELASDLDAAGRKRALIVCGQHVGANAPLMDALRDALGPRLVDIFDQTSPNKTLASVYAGIERVAEVGADCVIGVGGGSSLDTARQMSVFASDGRRFEQFRADAHDGRLTAPNCSADATPVLLVPTTLAGADVSSGGTIEVLAPSESPTGQPIRTNGALTPRSVIYDPTLFAMTPVGPLCKSAMNGFDKGLETIYSPKATPITDAGSVHGTRLMTRGLPGLVAQDPQAIADAVAGAVLVQLRRFTSIIHAFGHGISRHSEIQQGVGHAVLAPHVLRYVFSRGDARRDLVASALDLDTTGSPDDVAERIVTRVTEIRDSLNVPRSWADVPGAEELDFAAIAHHIEHDRMLSVSPVPIVAADAEDVLRQAR